jgi:hypothetical protein
MTELCQRCGRNPVATLERPDFPFCEACWPVVASQGNYFVDEDGSFYRFMSDAEIAERIPLPAPLLMSGVALRAARLLILRDEGAIPHDWLCEATSLLEYLSGNGAPTDADLRCLETLERIFARDLAQLG